jgi:general secretion pathway protein G
VSRILYPVSSKGFTLLELIVVIVILSILVGELLKRVPFYQEQAEKAVMEQTVGALQTALVMRYGALMTRAAANEKELKVLAIGNPMNWLQEKPRNYAGEYFDPAPQAIPTGNWFYDLKSHDLVYSIGHAEYFKPGSDGRKWIRFHTRIVSEPVLGRSESGKEVTATLIEPTEPYHWLD